MSGLPEILSPLFQLSRDAVLCLDGENRIVYKNPAAERLLSGSVAFPAEETVRRLTEELPDGLPESFVASACVDGAPFTVSAARVCECLVLTLSPCEGHGRRGLPLPPELLGVLRSEMFNIRLAAEQLVGKPRGVENVKHRDYAAVLYHSYYSMLRLIGNIDTANHLLSGSLPFFRAPTDMVRLCGSLVDSIYHFLREEGKTLSFETELPCLRAEVDAGRIEQLLLNLISNSIRHTGEGDTIKLSLKLARDSFIISVDDSGDGIEPEALSSLFARYLEDLPLSARADGAGLGLFIAKGIAELHGGALLMESRAGEGTRARVMLPVGTEDCTLREPSAAYEGSLTNTILTELSGVFGTEKYTYRFTD